MTITIKHNIIHSIQDPCDLKNLRLSKLEEQVKEFLYSSEFKDFDLQKRIHELAPLSEALQDLSSKINASLWWSQRAASYLFFFQTKEQKQISSLIALVNRFTPNTALQRGSFSIFWQPLKHTLLSIQSYVLSSLQVEKLKACAFRILIGCKADLSELDNQIIGSQPSHTLPIVANAIHDFLYSFSPFLTQEQVSFLDSSLQYLAQARTFAFDVSWISMKRIINKLAPGEREATAYEIGEKIDELKIGSRLLVPGGYMFRGQGHAVFYEILRESEEIYRFTIFNTGEGANLGEELVSSYPLSEKTFRPVSFLATKEAVNHPQLWLNLVDCVTNPFSLLNSIHTVYNRTSEHFEKYRAKVELRSKHSRQQWGSCAFEPILMQLASILPKDLYLALHLHITLRAKEELENLLPQARTNQALDKPTLDLLEEQSSIAAERVQRKLEKFWQNQPSLKLIKHLQHAGLLASASHWEHYLQGKIEKAKTLEGTSEEQSYNLAIMKERALLYNELDCYTQLLAEKCPEKKLFEGRNELFEIFQDLLQRSCLTEIILKTAGIHSKNG